ncbi:MAG: HAMP domain-containing sensor histidine kinase [Polyangiales bacterium]
MRLAQRLWILLTIPVFLSLLAYGFLGAREHRRQLVAEAEQEVGETATLLATTFALLPRDIEDTELHRLGDRLTRDSRVLGVGFYDARGLWVGGSRVARERSGALDPYARAALSQRRAFQGHVTLSGRECVLGVEALAPAGPSESAPAGALVVIRDLGYIDVALGRWGTEIALIGVALTLLMAIAAWVAARSITDPIERFLAGVDRVASGDLDAAVPDDRGAEEVRRLGRSFNALTRSLRGAQARLAEEEAARAAMETELHQAQTLAVAGQVAATLGHEIGSPLNVILGRARMAAEREGMSDDERATFTSIAAQAERITKILSQFLTLARPPRRDASARTDAAKVAREVVSFLGHECRRRKVSATVEADDPVVVSVEHDRLFQVVFNLCMNAVQAQPDGGRLRVRVWRDVAQGDAARGMVEVADDGPGIAPELRGRVFDPFFSTKLSQGGTGLGLAVVAGTVKELGGRVTVEQGDDAVKGARFIVALPSP